ncbi:I78 family peptidase inhibitor [Maricaulaceae bacterium EIL42A08]|nr:I78 family peptidase inhibitor [Maricaulaceae bacterium EIL42A08]MCP2679901.1 I78 family peptidase inhibitor [Maricaulaceae bacterium NA33B04]
MTGVKWIIIVAGLALASACATVPADTPTQPAEPNVVDRTGEVERPAPEAPQCAAEAYQVLVGQRIGEVYTESLPVPHRIYSTTDMVTMDYRPERLNIVTSPEGEVVEVKCG